LKATYLTGGDHARIYDDVLVVLDAARGVNNGSPSLHALMLHHLGIRPGDRILQVGAGTGYYCAILAELAQPAGRVTAVEFDPHLAAAAAVALEPWPQVSVITGDGEAWPTAAVDRIYVCFAVAGPAAAWTDHLAPHGTLVFPLGVSASRSGNHGCHSVYGALLALTRTDAGIGARHLASCAFVCAEGALAGTPAQQDRLRRAFAGGGAESVRSFRRPPPANPEGCWYWSPDWALSFEGPSAE
jgi:protein-L-isoaspartate(D-aspartate) O-methyltransferase